MSNSGKFLVTSGNPDAVKQASNVIAVAKRAGQATRCQAVSIGPGTGK